VQQVLLKSAGPKDTHAIGLKVGSLLNGGDVVCLYGEVGAGKTTMVKGIGSAFGLDSRDITSASFTIIAEYPTDPVFNHVDLYRLSEGVDVLETGLYDHIDTGHVTVIEWAERLPELPENAIEISLKIISENEREIVIKGIDEKDWDHM